MKLSVIIPAHHEPYTQRTVDSILENSDLGGDIEVIVVLDGWHCQINQADRRVKVMEINPQQGMREAINTALRFAQGEFIFKVDAHCSFAPGFDRVLTENCDGDWLVIPRRYSLDEMTWDRDLSRPVRDYCYLAYPTLSKNGYAMTPHNYNPKKVGGEIDDVMTYQGSAWMANRREWDRRIGYMDDRPETYGPFASEMLEVGLKYWLGGGQVKVNKKTWYAHLAKMQRHRDAGTFSWGYKSARRNQKHFTWAAKHWLNDEEPGMVYPFAWLVEKFMPLPTWPEDRNLWRLA